MYGLTPNTMHSLITTDICVNRTTKTHMYICFSPYTHTDLCLMLRRGLTLLLCSSHTWRSLDASDLLLGDIYWPKYKVTHPFFLNFSLSFFLLYISPSNITTRSPLICHENCLHITPLQVTCTIYHFMHLDRSIAIWLGIQIPIYTWPHKCVCKKVFLFLCYSLCKVTNASGTSSLPNLAVDCLKNVTDINATLATAAICYFFRQAFGLFFI